jgi:hypothetical protein
MKAYFFKDLKYAFDANVGIDLMNIILSKIPLNPFITNRSVGQKRSLKASFRYNLENL